VTANPNEAPDKTPTPCGFIGHGPPNSYSNQGKKFMDYDDS